MRLTLAADDGEVMDSATLTWDDWQRVTRSGLGAMSLLSGMHAWDDGSRDPDDAGNDQ